MSGNSFDWQGQSIPFLPGQTIATALTAAGILHFGQDQNGQPLRYFCGIGACQNCTVRVDGVVREACLTLASAGAAVQSLESGNAA